VNGKERRGGAPQERRRKKKGLTRFRCVDLDVSRLNTEVQGSVLNDLTEAWRGHAMLALTWQASVQLDITTI
jgi:hypothetical protein